MLNFSFGILNSSVLMRNSFTNPVLFLGYEWSTTPKGVTNETDSIAEICVLDAAVSWTVNNGVESVN